MPRHLLNIISPLLAAALAGGLYAQMRSYGTVDDTTQFHAAVRAAVDEIPVRMGVWEGTDAKAPAAAGQLLRPNALFARRYRDLAKNTWATLIVIHCRDSRDMSGHYPPNCYGGSGWTQAGDPTIRNYQLWGRSVPVAAYQFSRAEFDRVNSWLIFDFFVLPTGGFVTSMVEVDAASGDYRTRPYGCAQIQVIVDAADAGDMTQEDLVTERESLLMQMLEPLGPVIQSLQATRPGGGP